MGPWCLQRVLNGGDVKSLSSPDWASARERRNRGYQTDHLKGEQKNPQEPLWAILSGIHPGNSLGFLYDFPRTDLVMKD